MVLGIYGSGGSGRDLFSLILQEGKDRCWDEVVFIDDTKPEGIMMEIKMMPFELFCRRYSAENAKIMIALGEPEYRKMIFQRVHEKGYALATYIHDSVKISKFAEVAEGAVILDDVFVSPMVKIGTNVWINGYSIIGHDVQIGDHCQISSHVIVTGNTVVSDCVYIGVGASIRERISIGEFAVISMGAVVLKSVRPEMIAMGNPAREIAVNEKHRVFE